MSAAETLRTARRRHGLTQAQLAARARTSQAAISRIERGLVSPTVATLATLLDMMGEELVLDAQPIDDGHDPRGVAAQPRAPGRRADRPRRGVRELRPT